MFSSFLFILYLIFLFCFFFFNDTATTEIYTFPYTTLFRSITEQVGKELIIAIPTPFAIQRDEKEIGAVKFLDRKSTRLNSSHSSISYAVFCLKKKKKKKINKQILKKKNKKKKKIYKIKTLR